MIISPLSDASFGAQVDEINVGTDMTADVYTQLRAALLQYKVLVFRGQDLTRDQHVAFSKWFGPLEDQTSFGITAADYPCVAVYDDLESVWEKNGMRNRLFLYRAGHLHAYLDVPPRVATFRALRIPSTGGNGIFYNLYELFNSFSDLFRANFVDAEVSVFSYENYKAKPFYQQHPETGEIFCWYADNQWEIEGKPLDVSHSVMWIIRALLEQNPKAIYMHKWEVNDLVVWDNLGIIQKVVNNYVAPDSFYFEKVAVLP